MLCNDWREKMSEIYIVNCYTCQHNGQESCKGCTTIGKNGTYINWELRQDLKEKNQQIDQLNQQLAEKDGEINSLIADYEKRISQEQELMSNMEHQLAEKQNTIDEINKEFVQAVHDWKVLCVEKDKEIERLKVFEKIYYQNQLQASQETINKLFQSAYQSPIAVGLNEIAIQELEKVNEYIEQHKYKTFKEDRYVVYYKSLKDQIDNQIKALKGEKDVKD